MTTKDPPPLAVGVAGSTTGSSKMSQQQWFISDIQQMMHGLGDCRKPLHESAVLVEEITQQQMVTLLYRASDVASVRGGKLIGVEDILFLMRKDKVKLRRLLRYMDMKDLRSSIQRTSSVDDEESGEQVPAGDVKGAPARKRRKLCYDFLSTIDQTGELLALFNDETVDDVKYERLLRAELKSRCLDPQQYVEFSEARQVNFSRKYKSQRFKDWLLTGVNLEIKPSLHALELMSYMTYETVAQIVDLALLVKQDMLGSVSEPVVHTLPSINHTLTDTVNMATRNAQGQKLPGMTSPTVSPPSTPSVSGQTTPTIGNQTPGQQTPGSSSKSKSKKKKKSGSVTLEATVSKAILPSDIQEAVRRYSHYIGPFATQMKTNPLSTVRSVIFSI